MGGGAYTRDSFATYCSFHGKAIDTSTGYVLSGQTFESRKLNESLDVRKGQIRECCNSDEHPNTVPVILALDVTGSMGGAATETAQALGQLMAGLYDSYKDIEICVMGIGDTECDSAPLQVGQFESDVRVAEQLDKLWLEFGGGGNGYESYTAAWWYGLYRTKLDAYDKQGRKGIIITMGDEPLNPILDIDGLKRAVGEDGVGDTRLKTEDLYEEAKKKFDIYHISVNHSSYHHNGLEKSYKKVIGDSNFFECKIPEIKDTIRACIDRSLKGDAGNSSFIETSGDSGSSASSHEISW